MEYTIVPKEEALEHYSYKRYPWTYRITRLKPNQAGKISGLEHKDAERMRRTLLATMRVGRRISGVHTKVVKDGDSFALYFWRDEE